MNVKVVSITKSLIEGKELSAEDLIVYTARVSNPTNQMNTETSDRLLNYLIKNKHWSPFDMVDLTLEIKTSRAIAQQILRHWSARFQEFSQRYAEAVELEPIQIRKAGATTRQGSAEEFDPKIEVDMGNDIIPDKASDAISDYLQWGENLYKALLQGGVAKECARMILPLTTQTTIYMKGSVRTWMFYLAQRLDPHAQLEHREVAQEAEKIFQIHFPNVHKAFFQDGQ
ncbi:MAG: FAD-dependent thymidylate synthase [Legionellaceae bacterium]|nr:FAD-dependent thymidylate synthase [Legionellaceae bacterium]